MAKTGVESAVRKVKIKGFIQLVIGWILAAFNGLMFLIGCFSSGLKTSDDVVAVSVFLWFVIGGAVLIFFGNQKMKLIKAFREYSSRLAADPEKSIDLLASAAGVTVMKATKNIRKMIEYGFFPGCYLDGKHNKIVRFAPFKPYTAGAPATNRIKYVTVQCKGCGAKNKIACGTVGECEYCGSKISE